MPHKTTLLSIFLIIILGFTVYGGSMRGSFIWDDGPLIKENSQIKKWPFITDIFTKPVKAYAETFGFYRPIQMLTYAADHALWKLNARGYHFTNILLHILAALSLYWLTNILFGNRILALLTSILFTVHPIHTEAVAYISGRADSLVTIFTLLCFVCYIKYIHSGKIYLYLLMIFSYALALLSRENSIILPMVILLYHHTFKEKINVKGFLAILGIALAYVAWRLMVFSSVLPVEPANMLSNLSDRISLSFVAITNYTRLLLAPVGLHMEYSDRALTMANAFKAVLGMLITLLLLTYAVKKRGTNRLISFSIFWFFITLSPQLNIYPVNAYMAEHWLYLPSIGFFLILANSLTSFMRHKNMKIAAIIFTISLVGLYSALTIKQNGYWKNPVTMYERTLRYSPNNYRLFNNLGNEYSSIGNKKRAIELFVKAIEIKPDYTYPYINLGNTYKSMGDHKKVMAFYKKAVVIDPDYAGTYYNMAIEYYNQKQYDLAIRYCDKATSLGYEVDRNFLAGLQQYRK